MLRNTTPVSLIPIIGAICGLLVVIGSFGPWASAWIVTVSGLDGDGIFTLGLGLAAGVAMLMRALQPTFRPWLYIVAIIGFVGAFGVGFYDWVRIQDVVGENDSIFPIAVGWGLKLVTIAGAVGLITAVVEARRVRKTHRVGADSVAAEQAV